MTSVVYCKLHIGSSPHDDTNTRSGDVRRLARVGSIWVWYCPTWTTEQLQEDLHLIIVEVLELVDVIDPLIDGQHD